MISKNKNYDNHRNFRGLENEVPQHQGPDQEDRDDNSIKNPDNGIRKTVHQGEVETTTFDPQLEEQWLAVRDEYLAHYPELEDTDIEYEEGSFYKVIDSLSKKRQVTPKEIQHEIRKWSR